MFDARQEHLLIKKVFFFLSEQQYKIWYIFEIGDVSKLTVNWYKYQYLEIDKHIDNKLNLISSHKKKLKCEHFGNQNRSECRVNSL